MRSHEVIAAGAMHLSQNRLRAGLSILGICIGIASVLCMIAIGEGAKLIIAKDIEKLGGANQVQFWTRTSIWKHRRLVRRTTERYTAEDAFVSCRLWKCGRWCCLSDGSSFLSSFQSSWVLLSGSTPLSGHRECHPSRHSERIHKDQTSRQCLLNNGPLHLSFRGSKEVSPISFFNGKARY